MDLSIQLGVSPVLGGQHPIWGTRNALLALGSQVYLEVMGPDPTLSRPGLIRPFAIDRLPKPHLATWVCRSEDLDKTTEIGRQAGVELGKIISGSRTKPDGSVLSWSMTDLLTEREGGIVPYFIDWGASVHPAASAPRGCILKELKAEHPDPDRIRSILRAFELDLPIDYGRRFTLKAVVETKRGLVELE